MIPTGHFVVAESGISCRSDVLRLQHAGARGFLVGESLMREEDIGAKLRELQGDAN
jgi:indole-3-glycerol phosphate synthase